MALLSRLRIPAAYAAGMFIAAIFLDSLRFKFTGHPTPQHIFTTLRDWSGIELFYPAGPWIIGLSELGAALLLLAAPLTLRLIGQARFAGLAQALGGLAAMVIMTGAISFHLFTPLGIETPTVWENGEIVESGAFLFIAACITWLCGALVVALRGREAMAALSGGLAAPYKEVTV
jgi:uncharacterized membrane protein YkgB